MELRDYLQMLRRGWPVVVVFTLAALAAAGFYLAVAPKTYTASAAVVLVTNQPQSIPEAQQGAQLTQSSASTVASIIDSPAVLSAVSAQLTQAVSTTALVDMVSTSARTGTSVIDITVTGTDPREIADIANLTADSAAITVAGLGRSDDSTSPAPMRLEQIVGAAVPTAPASPDVRGVLVIGVIIGLATGIGIAVLRFALDTRIHHAEDLRRGYVAPLLAVIPRSRRFGWGRSGADDPLGPGSEGFRTLRTNLGYLENSARRSFALAAAGDDRGGPSTAIKLALSFAHAGRRTLLIDCDLRQDAVGAALGVRHSLGLADVLGGYAELDAVVRPTDHALLNVVLAGAPRGNPSDLLSSRNMSLLLTSVEHEYDDVILHAPSLQGVSDAAIVAHAAEWTVITVAAGRTTVRQLTEAIGALERVHVIPVGLVLVGKRGRLAPLPAPRNSEVDFASLDQVSTDGVRLTR